MLTVTSGFYHFIPLSSTLTLPGATRSAERKTSWLHFLSQFSTEILYGFEVIQFEHITKQGK